MERATLKEIAKSNLKGTWFWNTIVVGAVSWLLLGDNQNAINFGRANGIDTNIFNSLRNASPLMILCVLAFTVGFAILVCGPLVIGTYKYYLEVAKGNKPMCTIVLEPFKNYWHNVLAIIE